jgi:putative MATE family efflux protein
MRGDAYPIAVQYLRIDAYGHLFTSITVVIGAALRGIGDMRRPMIAYAIINAVNIVASTAFVYLADMGVTGIVAGTVTARVVGAAVLLGVLARGRAGLRLDRTQMRVDMERVRRILRIGVPAAIDGAIMWVGHFAFLAIITRVAEGAVGQASFAAHVIAVRVEALTYLPALAWATAAATIIGQSLGARDAGRAKRVGHEAVLQCGVIAVAVAIVFYFAAAAIYRQMSVDELVRSIGPGPFRVLALLQPCMAVSIVYIGGMRGAGDTRYPMLITVAGIVIRLSLGYYFGIVRDGGLMGAWMGMFGDMIWRAVAAAVRFLRGQWVDTRV